MQEQQVRDRAIELVVHTAAKIRDRPAALLNRPKSLAYIYGTLTKEFPALGGQEVRQVIASIRESDLPDDDSDERRELRPPTRGREPLEDAETWMPRITRLFSLVVDPTTTDELIHRAELELGWDRNWTIQVIAAAETQAVVVYDNKHWHPGMVLEEERLVVTKEPRQRIVKGKRTLPCKLKQSEIVQATKDLTHKRQRLRDVDAELSATIAYLKNRKRSAEIDIEELETKITEGYEMREVEIEEIHNLDIGRVRVRRIDSKDIVDDREMTGAERQPSLFDGIEGQDASAPA